MGATMVGVLSEQGRRRSQAEWTWEGKGEESLWGKQKKRRVVQGCGTATGE